MKRLKKLTFREFLQKLKINWKTKYRLVIKNSDTHQEKFSFRLSPQNVFVVVTTFTVFWIAVTAMLIAFTPLRVYVPGYTTPDEYRKYKEMATKVEQIQQQTEQNQQFIDNFCRVLNDKVIYEEFDVPKSTVTATNSASAERPKELEELESQADAILERQGSADAQAATIPLSTRADVKTFFLKNPTNGLLVQGFNDALNHYGIDVQSGRNALISSVEKGVVIFAGFDPTFGNSVIIQHHGNLISKYLRCGELLTALGEQVESGEIIARMGSSGSAEKGVHLHFELWYNGAPVNPELYLTY